MIWTGSTIIGNTKRAGNGNSPCVLFASSIVGRTPSIMDGARRTDIKISGKVARISVVGIVPETPFLEVVGSEW